MDLLYGCYRRSSAELHCLLTNQVLRLVEEDRQAATFDYIDADVRERVTIAFRYWDRSLGWERGIEFAWPAQSRSRTSYGTWRRLTFFLLDALLAFYADEDEVERRVSSVTLAGGWFNGSWQDGGRFESTKVESGPDRLAGEVRPFAPFALDARPPLWRFERGFEGAREGNIQIRSNPSGPSVGLPLADLSIPIFEQLAEVPRCLSTTGEILFFHRVVPFLGPEYAPGMDYGLCTEGYAFTISDFHASLRGLPIRLQVDASADTAIVWIESMALQGFPPTHAILHPCLRERLLFAGVDAYTAMQLIPREEMPLMADLQHEQEMRFHPRCNHLSLAPLSTGLGFVGTAGYPPLHAGRRLIEQPASPPTRR